MSAKADMFMRMMHREYQSIVVGVEGHVATITLNRPEKKNALSGPMVNELIWAFDDAKDSEVVRAVVLRGAGHTFCAGADLGGMSADDGGFKKKGEFDDLLLRFDRMHKPIVAAVEGYAMGGAVGLIAAAHFVVASRSAILATPEIKRGVFPMMIMAVMQRVLSQRELLKMILLGERISADEALRIGLVTHIADDQEFDAVLGTLTNALASQSPTAMSMGLNAYARQRSMPIEDALPFLREQLAALLGTEDAREGLSAFFQKREPVWKGR
ncbi:MAG: enoyl-CoA hydratase-related protein [Polyangiales bacterium]